MSFIAAIAPLNLDLLYSGLPRVPHLGEEVYSKGFSMQVGGGPAGSLIVARKLGLPVRLGTFLSNDNISHIIRGMLDGYNLEYINIYKGEESPIMVTSIASFPEDRYFLTYKPEIVDGNLNFEEAYKILKGAKVCFGFLGNNDLLKQLKKDGTEIIFDTGWNDNLHVDNLKSILKYVSVFTPNDKEALKMTETSNLYDALDTLSKYTECPVITLGEMGCVSKLNKDIIYCPPLKGIKAVDTTGAGDNFLSGIAFGLYNNRPLDECMKIGNIIGGISTTSLGCCSTDITLNKIEALLPEIEVEIISPESLKGISTY